MNRRSFIISGSKSLGGIGFTLLLPFSSSGGDIHSFNTLFSTEEVRLMNEIGEVIIPATGTPGAKAAKVGEFIAVIVEDCYSENEKREVKDILVKINSVSNSTYGRIFLRCKEKERVDLISKMEKEYKGYTTLKNLIVSAYLSSEIGATQFFKYHPVPGKYDGCTSVRPW